MGFWDAATALPTAQLVFLLVALVVAFGFEFVNGFHDTANAVTTVIYTKTLKPTPAVAYSGFLNFLGVYFGGTLVAFSIVHLLPVDLLVSSTPGAALLMVLALLASAVSWNLGTWYLGLPVSSSHALIGSILGVGVTHGLLVGKGLAGVNWHKATEVGLALVVSPVLGFVASAGLLLLLKRVARDPELYVPPPADGVPPRWVRGTLIGTCGLVSFAHGSNDGQKGMGLILLVLIGFLPGHYALEPKPTGAAEALAAVERLAEKEPSEDLTFLKEKLAGKRAFHELEQADRWPVRQALYRTERALPPEAPEKKAFRASVEFIPTWVVIGVALALGVGTTIGYKRIVITVAEKIGKTHLTYAQGAAAEVVAAITILMADIAKAPVSTTQVLSSGIAGTMAANGSGIQGNTIRKILMAWVFTMPTTMIIGGALYAVSYWLVGG